MMSLTFRAAACALVGAIASTVLPAQANEVRTWQGVFRQQQATGALVFEAKERQQRIEVPGVFNPQGHGVLIRFNSQPALEYQSLAMGVPARVVATLYPEGQQMKIDCLYVSTRSGLNGALLKNAVCGLGRVLDEHLADLAHEYSERWGRQGQAAGTQPDAPSQGASVLLARWGELEVRREYLGANALAPRFERLTISSPKASYGFANRDVYLVYAASNLQVPDRLEVGGESEPWYLQGYQYPYLQRLLDSESTFDIAQGPFANDVVPGSRLSVLRTGDEAFPLALMLDHTDAAGKPARSLVDSYSFEGGPPTLETLFYYPIKGVKHVVVLVSWRVEHRGIGTTGTFYEIHAYQPGDNGGLVENQQVRRDAASNGLDGMGDFQPSRFPYQNAALIKGYLKTLK